jgi:hypothetical protein
MSFVARSIIATPVVGRRVDANPTSIPTASSISQHLCRFETYFAAFITVPPPEFLQYTLVASMAMPSGATCP